jgi:hypothetical protein
VRIERDCVRGNGYGRDCEARLSERLDDLEDRE